jgi:hypothetical protein
VQEYVKQLEGTSFFAGAETPLSLEALMAYYRQRIPMKRAAFRSIAIGVVALGLANAFIAARGETFLPVPAKDTLVVVLSLLVGAVGTLNSVFRFESQWTSFTSTLMALEHLKRRWEKAKVDALTSDDQAAALATLRREAWDVQEQAHSLITEETKGFFSSRRLPEAGKA